MGADVVSIGELMLAIKAGVSPRKIVFSGVGKTSEEISYAISKKILLINAESSSEIKMLANNLDRDLLEEFKYQIWHLIELI